MKLKNQIERDLDLEKGLPLPPLIPFLDRIIRKGGGGKKSRGGGGRVEGQDFPTLDATAVPEKVFVPSAPFPPSLPGRLSNRTAFPLPSIENKLIRPDNRKGK